MPSVYTVSREQFEQRMRARRAATCLSVARSAIAGGKMAEAIDRLEEACRLSPDLAEAQLLLDDLRAEELRTAERTEQAARADLPPQRSGMPVRPSTPMVRPAVPLRRSEMSGWSHWVAAAIAICALATLAFLWPSRPSGQDGLVEPTREVPSASPTNGPPPTATGTVPTPGLTAHDQQLPGPPSAVGTGGGADAGNGESAPDKGGVAITVTEQPAVQRPFPSAPASQPDAGRAVAAATPASSESSSAFAGTHDAERTVATSSPSSAPPAADATVAANLSNAAPMPSPQLPPLQRVPVTDETPVKPFATPEPEPVTAPVARASDVPAEASLRATASDTGAIEGTLRRYADAYTHLDAAAARAVWPTVDQRALARAFEGLESQGIVFEHCDVAVAGDDASAACNGRARYVPKVGSREPFVERRLWSFRLRKADAGWQIIQAEAR